MSLFLLKLFVVLRQADPEWCAPYSIEIRSGSLESYPYSCLVSINLSLLKDFVYLTIAYYVRARVILLCTSCTLLFVMGQRVKIAAAR